MVQHHAVRFGSGVATTPLWNRKRGARDRAASIWMRVVAVGFLVGLASSVALWLYDRFFASETRG